MASTEENQSIAFPKSFWSITYYWDEDDSNDWSYIKGSLSVDVEKFEFFQKRKKYGKYTWYYKTKKSQLGTYSSEKLQEGWFKGIANHKIYGSSKKSALAKAEKRLLKDIKDAEIEAKNGDEYYANLLKKVYPLIKSSFTKIKKQTC